MTKYSDYDIVWKLHEKLTEYKATPPKYAHSSSGNGDAKEGDDIVKKEAKPKDAASSILAG